MAIADATMQLLCDGNECEAMIEVKGEGFLIDPNAVREELKLYDQWHGVTRWV